MTEHRTQSNLAFRMMALEFRIRDLIWPPIKILEETGVKQAMNVLDFGCGPGGFSIAAARLVGPEGKVYAVDIHPLAIESVKRAAAGEGIRNIHPIHGSDIGEIPTESIDIVLLYDVLHDFDDPAAVLAEINRVLKSNGLLSVSDHHLNDKTKDIIVANGLFRF